MEGARLAGILTRGDLLRGIAAHGTNLSVQQAMHARWHGWDGHVAIPRAIALRLDWLIHRFD